jgi:hypothetical protein
MVDRKIPDGCKIVDGKMKCDGQNMGKIEKMRCDKDKRTGKEQCVALMTKEPEKK